MEDLSKLDDIDVDGLVAVVGCLFPVLVPENKDGFGKAPKVELDTDDSLSACDDSSVSEEALDWFKKEKILLEVELLELLDTPALVLATVVLFSVLL